MLSGNPAPMVACRAGACPKPADNTLPIITSSINKGSNIVSFNISEMTNDPSLGAETTDRPPWNDPIGVRLADTITTLCFLFIKY